MQGAQEGQNPHHGGVRAVYIVIYAGLLLILAAVDPFGLKSAADSESRDLFFNIVSPFYRLDEPTEAVVVLIEDDSLAAAGESYPPSFLFYDSMLGSLLDLGARGVFLDILFADDRTGAAAFGRTLRQYEEAGMPIILASGATPGEACEDIEGRERQLPAVADEAAYLAAVYFERIPGIYEPTVALGCAPERRRSAALEMFRLWCPDAECRRDVTDIESHPPSQKMVVQWGNAPPDVVRELYPWEREGCRQRPSDVLEATIQSLGKLWAGLGSGLADGNPLLDRCAYLPRIHAQDLVPGATVLSPARVEMLRRAVEGKVVFVGMHLHGVDDVTSSAVHGVLPGVFLHAMAFDNFVAMGDAYFRPWPTVFMDLGLDDVVEIVLLLMVVAAEDRVRGIMTGAGGTAPTIRRSFCILACFLLTAAAVLFLMALTMTLVLRVEPVNWLGIVGISLLLVQEEFQNLMRRVAARLLGVPDRGV